MLWSRGGTLTWRKSEIVVEKEGRQIEWRGLAAGGAAASSVGHAVAHVRSP